MNIVGIEKLTLVDYPGKVSCIIFLRGCNFLCPFCHNKELVLPSEQKGIPLEEILDFLKTRRGKLDGVVISGGEPTLDPDLVYIIKQIKELGFLIKLDTNGSNSTLLNYLIDNHLVDYVAMDIKNSFSKYNETSGVKVNLEEISKSIQILKENKVPYEFRMTTIEEFHTSEDIIEIGKMLDGAENFYFQKYVDSSNCIVGGFHPVNKEKIEEFVSLLSPYIRNVCLRGY